MDPQGNMSSGLGVDKNEVEKTIYELIIGKCKIEECICKEPIENLSVDVLPSSIDLSAAEIELIGVDNKEYILRDEVEKIKDNYDFIIIDCPPALSMLTINAMTTSDSVIVPIQCEYYALEGLSQLMHTIELVQDRLNPKLEMEGVVFTMYDARTNLSLQVVENVKDILKQNIYKTIIPRNVRLAEAPSYGMPINYYDKRSTGAESYRLLADEVIHRGDEKKRDEYYQQYGGRDYSGFTSLIEQRQNDVYEAQAKLDAADVSYYVKMGSAIWEYAELKGNSDYLANKVGPMLPVELSNGICSLNPNEDRYALSCTMEIDHAGHIVNQNVYLSVIKSKKKMNYDAVQDIIENKDTEDTKDYITLKYTVKENETIDDIAFKNSITKEKLLEFNNIENIKPGNEIDIPTRDIIKLMYKISKVMEGNL